MTQTAEPTTLEIGKSRVRKEDERLISGRSRYTDSITPPPRHSPWCVPRSRERRSTRSTSPRPKAPGVHGVYTAADLGAEGVGLPCAWPITRTRRRRSARCWPSAG